MVKLIVYSDFKMKIEKVIEKLLNIFFLGNLEQILEFMYINVNINNIELYLTIAKCIYSGTLIDLQVCNQYLHLYKNTPNLQFYETLNIINWCIYNLGEENIVNKCRENIKHVNNHRINKLWWLWLDYSGEYKSYIEWLPRETLDDLLMISNFGKYTPDYTTYVE